MTRFDDAVAAHGSYEYEGTQGDGSHVVSCTCSNPDGVTDFGVFFSGASRAEAVDGWVEHLVERITAAAYAELAELNERIDALRKGGSVPPPTTEQLP